MGIAMQKKVSDVNDNWLYALMDKGFSANAIRDYASETGHKAIIDYPLSYRKNPQNQKKLSDFEKEIYKNRSDVERFFSDLKDNFGIHRIYVKKHAKVKLVLEFASIALIIKKLYYQEKLRQP
jgi:transposase